MAVRFLAQAEKKARGCAFCADAKYVSRKRFDKETTEILEKNERILVCPYGSCPYNELDGYTDYRDYERDVEYEFQRDMSRAIMKAAQF